MAFCGFCQGVMMTVAPRGHVPAQACVRRSDLVSPHQRVSVGATLGRDRCAIDAIVRRRATPPSTSALRDMLVDLHRQRLMRSAHLLVQSRQLGVLSSSSSSFCICSLARCAVHWPVPALHGAGHRPASGLCRGRPVESAPAGSAAPRRRPADWKARIQKNEGIEIEMGPAEGVERDPQCPMMVCVTRKKVPKNRAKASAFRAKPVVAEHRTAMKIGR